jgi:hypothetical protein
VLNPTLDKISDISICSGDKFPAIDFKGNLPAEFYEWTNSNANIGLPFNGQGNIGSFTGINNSLQ